MNTTCTGPNCNRPIRIKKSGLCKTHYQQYSQGRELTPIRVYVERKPAPAGYLHCTKCDNFKPDDQFYVRNNGKPQQHCKPCFIAENRKDALIRQGRWKELTHA